MTIGEKIAKYRNECNMTQKKLSELSGLSEISIRKYEAGDRNPKYTQLSKIAKALLLSPAAFLEDDLSNISINSVGDLISTIFELEEKTGFEITYSLDEVGQVDPESICAKFTDPSINKILFDYLSVDNTIKLMTQTQRAILAREQNCEIDDPSLILPSYANTKKEALRENKTLLLDIKKST